MRLVDHLKTIGLSARQARQEMRSGKVLLQGVPVADGGREVDPAEVRYDPNAPRIRASEEPVLLYRDDHLAVTWKPPGFLSVAAPRRVEDNLVSWAARVLRGDAHPVHRLDEQTSGLMLVARTASARAALIDMFQTHEIDRRYLALVHKTFPEEGRVERSMFVRDRGDGLRGSARPDREGGYPEGAREAITHLSRVEALRQDASVVEARLETGRTHQVRIHLAEAGFPVLGDPLYAPGQAQRRSARLALHAWKLSFPHPKTGETIALTAPLADDLERLRRTLDAPPAARPERAPRPDRETRGRRSKKKQTKRRR